MISTFRLVVMVLITGVLIVLLELHTDSLELMIFTILFGLLSVFALVHWIYVLVMCWSGRRDDLEDGKRKCPHCEIRSLFFNIDDVD